MKDDPDAVIQGVGRALKPAGRFVAEMGGHGNLNAITAAVCATLESFRHYPLCGLDPMVIPI